MQIREIYNLSIDRPINPAVVVSHRSPETIDAEIKEYIFTDELIENLYTLLHTTLTQSGRKTGIWVNGYYGSGKSHFIKYAHYCLEPATSGRAFEHYINAVEKYDTTRVGAHDNITRSNIELLRKAIRNANVSNIMFNVEDETDDGSGERLTRIFLDMLNKHRGYNSNDIPLAILLEKQLDRKGVFETFKERIKKDLGFDWVENAAQIASFALSSILTIAKELIPEMDIESLATKLSNPETYKVSVAGSLIPEFKDFLKGKEPGFRLIFLVDEVSQYIGKKRELLGNLQSIIERVSDDCNGQIWIACTAQQTLDEVTRSVDGTPDPQDEFGKILGRFDTRISLQSNDASFITQKRVLDKNSTGIKALQEIYHKNEDYIHNQFKIRHELYKGYETDEDFILAYPFVPYQFKLIAHVFDAFQQLKYVIKEVKDNERSVISITHFTAQQHANDELGLFMPFDAFFNSQFITNLTHRGQRALQNALALNYVKEEPFAMRVVHCLFMISNLLPGMQQTFPSNIDNLTVLMMNVLDQNRNELQTRITEVLNKLQEENIIREEKGSYFFFNEDEIDVQNLIKSQTLTLDDRLSVFDEYFRKMTRLTPTISYGRNDFKVGYWVDDKEFFRRADVKLTVMIYDQSDLSRKALEHSNTDLVIAFSEQFYSDHNLRNDFEWNCKTRKFFQNNADAATGERAKTIENFRIRNESLEGRIRSKFERIFQTLRMVSGQFVWESNHISGSQPPERLKNILEKHLERIYKYEKLSHLYARNQLELKTSASQKQTLMPNLSPAEEMVDTFITNHADQITVEELVRNFEKPPFGWRAEALLDILVHLVKKRKREFSYHNRPRFEIVDFINKAVISSERPVCVVKKGEEIDQSALDQAVMDYRDIFNQDLAASTDGNELYETLLAKLKAHENLNAGFEEEYYGNYPFGLAFHELGKLLNRWTGIRDPKTLFDTLHHEKQEAKIAFDNAKGMSDFSTRMRKDFDAIRKFIDANKENFSELMPAEQHKAEQLVQLLQSSDPRRDFRHCVKASEELKKALSDLTNQLRQDLVLVYENIFDELEAELAKNNIPDKHVIADRISIFSKINGLKSVPQLKNQKLNAANFKSGQLEAILNFASRKNEQETGTRVGEPEVLYITGIVSTIRNDEEMEIFITRIRQDIQALLKQNKTIIIK